MSIRRIIEISFAAVALVSVATVAVRPPDRPAARPTPPTAHVPLPAEVRGIYWNAVTTHDARRSDDLLRFMQSSDLNTAVLDVQYDSGALAFPPNELLDELRRAGIYRIARIAVMRNSSFAAANPSVALKNRGSATWSDRDTWSDRTGSRWLDPSAPEVAVYALELGRQAYRFGFDEIQYDYVRFASDGKTSAIVYPRYDGKRSKVAVMHEFFRRVVGTLRREGVPVSVDVFAITFWTTNDYNIGQRLVDVASFADVVSPMAYPSHYPAGFKGFKNPALYPYEIVKRTLDEGAKQIGEAQRPRFRPWLQDFDLGASYTPERIKAEIKAARDAGASGWLLWNARNAYTPLTPPSP